MKDDVDYFLTNKITDCWCVQEKYAFKVFYHGELVYLINSKPLGVTIEEYLDELDGKKAAAKKVNNYVIKNFRKEEK